MIRYDCHSPGLEHPTGRRQARQQGRWTDGPVSGEVVLDDNLEPRVEGRGCVSGKESGVGPLSDRGDVSDHGSS